MEELTMCEQSKVNTELYLAKIKQLENRTREDLNFLVDQAIKSAKMEITLAPIESRKDEELSELAQTIKKYPDYKFDKQVIFKEFLAESMKNDGITSEFTMIPVESMVIGDDIASSDSNAFNDYAKDGNGGSNGNGGSTGNSNGGNTSESGKSKGDVATTKKHSQARRTKLPVQSIKVDDCEIFISVARLKNTNKKKDDLEK